MAQSAVESKKTPLHVDAFWEKPKATPPHTRDKWTQQWKLALLVKEEIQLEFLLNGPPPTVTYPPEPTCEEPVEKHTQATERDRKVRNQQLNVNWQNRCKKIDEVDILCGDKTWGICEQKSVSLLYLSIGKKDVVFLNVNIPILKLRENHSKNSGKRWRNTSLKLEILCMIALSSFHLNNRSANPF